MALSVAEAAAGQAAQAPVEVTLFGQASGQPGGQPVVLGGGPRVAVEFQQVRADGVQPVVAARRRVGQQRVEQRQPDGGPWPR
ncbi:hypothetical protein [Micromonospora aurantiaca (nom. illeg.)]|uniref:hypothetical protein n=1 Tax=Micromonospora aurantiaca (nom. illeg.) TaxID=47850 RepID=UPI0033F73ABB